MSSRERFRHLDVGYNLYLRDKRASAVAALIDANLDDGIDDLIARYDKKSRRLRLPPFAHLLDYFRYNEYGCVDD